MMRMRMVGLLTRRSLMMTRRGGRASRRSSAGACREAGGAGAEGHWGAEDRRCSAS